MNNNTIELCGNNCDIYFLFVVYQYLYNISFIYVITMFLA